jgi:uncharacterized membrane protein YpjA
MLTTKRRTSRSISESQRFSRSSMQKSSAWPLVATLILVVLGATYGYMYYKNNNQEKKMNDLQTVMIGDAQTISAVVNFINSSIAQTGQQQ